MIRMPLHLLLLFALGLLPGCVVGYNSVLFATKSNVGFDFDAAPPTAELSISRVEGVIEPTFEGGRTLPVMASFKTQGEGLFAGGVGQTFTTGDAAVIMATLYGDEYPQAAPDVNWEEQVAKKFDSALTLRSKPQLPGEVPPFATTEVKPVFFGTTTSLGLKVSWSGMSGPNPDSLHLGYKRKELAWAPISMEIEQEGGEGSDVGSAEADPAASGMVRPAPPGAVYHMRVPSLLATIDASGDLQTSEQARFDWLQYFATGRSATALALRRDVRQAMLRRLDPEATQSLAAEFSATADSACIEAWLDETADEDPNPRREMLKTFIEQELHLQLSVTFWVSSPDEPGRSEQYQAFISRERIDCGRFDTGGP
jgi:hypothetical protein